MAKENKVQYEASDRASEELLERFDRYIMIQVERLRRYYPTVIHSPVQDLEIDELVQRVRIKFWQALEKREIRYPSAYIRRIARSEFADMVRRQRAHLFLPMDEGCIYGQAEAGMDHYVPDPADEVEQREEASARLKELVDMVVALPPQQRLAMMCMLHEYVDDVAQFTAVLKTYHIDSGEIGWPADRAQKQVLQASLAHARRSLARHMQSQST